jgi:hypothetical protein
MRTNLNVEILYEMRKVRKLHCRRLQSVPKALIRGHNVEKCEANVALERALTCTRMDVIVSASDVVGWNILVNFSPWLHEK